MVMAAQQHNIWVLYYGIVAGGFLGDRWLGQPEPQEPLENRSLTKYKLIIDDFSGWDLFQSLLQTLWRIADRHGVDTASVSSAAMLNRPGVAAVTRDSQTQANVAVDAATQLVQVARGALSDFGPG